MKYDIKKFIGLTLPIFPQDYNDLTNYEQMFRMADAFISCCIYLIYNMIDGELDRDFFLAKACSSIYRLAIEAFLKFTIIVASDVFPITHKIDQLFNHYCDFYPEDEFRFQTNAIRFVSENEAYPYNLFANYPVDDETEFRIANSHLELVSWLTIMIITQNDFRKIKPLILAKYKK